MDGFFGANGLNICLKWLVKMVGIKENGELNDLGCVFL